MPGKKRAASSKPTAGAKRQKSSGGSGGAPKRNTVKPEKQKSAKSIAKKDRKGKGPAYIPIPEVGGAGQRKKRRNGGVGDDDADDHAGDSSADEDEDGASYGEDEELDAGMDVDEDLADVDGADFLTRLDKKGMSACVSFPRLLSRWRTLLTQAFYLQVSSGAR